MSPFIAAVVLPFGVALALYAGGRFAPPLRQNASWAALCAAAGFLAGYVALEGWPPLVPIASKQKIFAIALLSAAIASGASVWPGTRARAASVLLWTLVAAGWIAIRRLGDPSTWLVAAGLAIGVAVLLGAHRVSDRRGAPAALAPIIALGVGFAAIALHGASASLSLLAAAVAATAGAMALVATAGELLGADPTPLGEPAAAVFAVVLMGVAATLVWFTPKVDVGALGVAAMAPLAGALATRFSTGFASRRALVEPTFLLLVALVPVGIAVLLASRSASLE